MIWQLGESVFKFELPLTISSFLTLSYLSDCLICTRNTMPIVLLLKMTEGQGNGIGERMADCN